MKTRLFGMLAVVLLSISASAQSEDYALANFDHEVTQPAPGGNTTDGGPQVVSMLALLAN